MSTDKKQGTDKGAGSGSRGFEGPNKSLGATLRELVRRLAQVLRIKR